MTVREFGKRLRQAVAAERFAEAAALLRCAPPPSPELAAELDRARRLAKAAHAHLRAELRRLPPAYPRAAGSRSSLELRG